MNVGHNRPEVKRAITEQLDELAYFQIFDGVSHPRVEELSAQAAGALVRPVGTKIILSPPLVYEAEHVDALVAALDQGFRKAG